MKNLIKLTLVFCLAFFSCENEKIDTKISGSSSDESVLFSASSSSNLFTNSCKVVNLNRCDGIQATANFWWPSYETDFNNGFFASNDTYKMSFTEFDNGTANIKGFTVMGTCVVEVNVWLKDKKDWAAFSADGGSFKDEENDCTGVIKEALHYYVIDSSKSTITASGGDCIEQGTFGIEQRPDAGNANDGDPNTLHLGALVGPGAGLFDFSKPDAYGLSTWGWITDLSTGERKWIMDLNFNLECQGIGSDCETAFAKGNSNTDSVCFIDDAGYKFNRWGWNIGPLSEGTYTYNVYAGAGQCDISKGALVGTVTVKYNAGKVDVTYNIVNGYELRETHVYAGKAKYPTDKKGKATVAPGQYTIQENLTGPIYVIAHAVVCN